jgi:hypothetical protein
MIEASSGVLNTLERLTVEGVYPYARWDVTEVDVNRNPTVASQGTPVCWRYSY